jgi:hypothetical protein
VKLVIYAGEQYLTGDEIAHALVDYSQALAENDTAESVTIPIREPDGSGGTAVFLVGPASQIVVKSVTSGQEELIDVDTVEEIRARIRRLRPKTTSESMPDYWL